PEKKDSLLKQIKENPASVHSLAGMKIFNFKTHRRKEAEQAVPQLCSAINVYAEAIKHTYKNMDIATPEENAAMKRNLQKSLDVQQKKASFSNEPLIDTEQNYSSVGQCYAEIERLSQLVYGNSHALQKQVEEVLEKPDMGEQFLWMIRANPVKFHKLAGHNMCGFKNDKRRRAEENILPLHDAVRNYTNAVKQTKELTSQERQRTSQYNIQPERSEGAAVHATVSSVKTSHSNEKMIGMIKSDRSVQRYYERIKFWSRFIYGDQDILEEPMQNILKNPAMGEQISQKVKKKPTSFHKLVGRNILGIKNEARKNAENFISYLCKAIEDYTYSVKQAEKSILQEQEKQQRFVVSEDQRQEAEQKFQKPQERQHTQQHRVQQYKASSEKGMAFAL
ncbi:BID domain-containing T4SS effector, partial [Bartonella taylorii]|uniref:BID domain-containing T4SS effector n=1 Tax=Bartonella taylorii TaxID=33046 RepID=UPI001ABA83A3